MGHFEFIEGENSSIISTLGPLYRRRQESLFSFRESGRRLPQWDHSGRGIQTLGTWG